jgi:hypothetical protein
MSSGAQFLPGTRRGTGPRSVVEATHPSTLHDRESWVPSVTRFAGATSPFRGGTL